MVYTSSNKRHFPLPLFSVLSCVCVSNDVSFLLGECREKQGCCLEAAAAMPPHLLSVLLCHLDFDVLYVFEIGNSGDFLVSVKKE